jgi:hypothetical protein
VPATELTVATRILSHLGMLAPDGCVAALVGSEVVYLAARGVSVATMTPYDVCAIRLGDATVLAGTPPDDAARYLAMLRMAGSQAVAATREADVGAANLAALIERITGLAWDEAEARARGAGALVGAYPAEIES